MLKKIIIYVLCLAPWFINTLIPLDYNYLYEIKTPFFTQPKLFYPIAWTIIYILISITTYNIFTTYKKDTPNSYKITLLINYLLNQSYTLIFFGLNNQFLGFVSCLGTLISTLFLYEETSLLNHKKKYLLIPYILLSMFATILSVTIFLINI